MELQKKTVPVEEARGWYLMQNEKRYWMEDFVDDDSGDVQSVERSENICGKGTQINDIILSMLIENDIKTVKVSNIPLLGNQNKSLNLWETALKIRSAEGEKKKSYLVTADCPSGAEKEISEYLEVNVDATFELIKVNKQDYDKVIKMYDSEREALEQSNKRVLWFRAQVYSRFDDEDNDSSTGSRNILIQAATFEQATEAIKTILGENEFESIYNTFKKVEELSIVNVFIPDNNVTYYSHDQISN